MLSKTEGGQAMLWGTIIGDLAGSLYEAACANGTKVVPPPEAPLFPTGAHITDDTVTTLAVAAAIRESKATADGLTTCVARQLRYWCRRYPGIGYGPLFIRWYESDTAGPYGSLGNGAAMRVAPVAWAGQSLREVLALAELTAVVTHNHPEAIRGALAVAAAIYLARKGTSQRDLRTYLQHYYPLQTPLAAIRRDYHFSACTADSVPEALEAFLASHSFEGAIRNALSLGGDTDTQAAIAGSIAEAYYGVPLALKTEAASFLPDPLAQERQRFECFIKNNK